MGREWMMEDGGRGDKGDVTFFSEESNKEPVLWTEKLLVLNWEWPWPRGALVECKN